MTVERLTRHQERVEKYLELITRGVWAIFATSCDEHTDRWALEIVNELERERLEETAARDYRDQVGGE